MKTCTFLLVASLWLVGCSKTENPPKELGTMCLVNKTQNDFVGHSFVSVFTIPAYSLPKNEKECFLQFAGVASWSAHLKFKDIEFATWVGGAELANGQTQTVDITEANKTFDFRDPLLGKYDLTVNCADVDSATNDTLATTSEMLVGDVAALPNVLELKITAGSQFDGIVVFSEDLYNFITPAGEVGQFSPNEPAMIFATNKITAPGVETRCRFQGKKQ